MKEILKKVHQIQIISRKLVDELLGGEYKSAFKGRGMEFDEVREYQLGDEIRTIDWNVTARTGKPFVKRFVEEREQLIFFLVDLSASGRFGSVGKSKNEIATELCALLAFSAIKNNDKVGLLLFTDQIELFIPPDKGEQHILRMIHELLSFKPKSNGTSISCALDYLGVMVQKRCVTFLFSDFQDTDYQHALKLAALHYDLIVITLADPRELTLPNAGLVELMDEETGEQTMIDTSSAAVQKRFKIAAHAHQLELKESFARLNIDQIAIQTDQDYIQHLIRFFRSRDRRQAS